MIVGEDIVQSSCVSIPGKERKDITRKILRYCFVKRRSQGVIEKRATENDRHLLLMTRNTKKDDVDEDRLQSLPPSKLLYHRTSGVTSTAAAGL